jgi:hypothetical protein
MMSTCCSKHVEAWNKYIEKECVKLVINQNYVEMHSQQNIKNAVGIAIQIFKNARTKTSDESVSRKRYFLLSQRCKTCSRNDKDNVQVITSFGRWCVTLDNAVRCVGHGVLCKLFSRLTFNGYRTRQSASSATSRKRCVNVVLATLLLVHHEVKWAVRPVGSVLTIPER